MAVGLPEGAFGEMRERADGVRAASDAQSWHASYVYRLRISDLLVIIWAVFAAQFVRFPFSSDAVGLGEEVPGVSVDYTMISIVLIVAWYAALSGVQAREPRILGTNSDEYRRVIEASMWVFGVFAILSYLLKFDLARGYFLTSIPLGVAGLLLSRWLWRKWLHIERRRGRMVDRVVVVGAPAAVEAVVRQLLGFPEGGYLVLGVCIDDGVPGSDFAGSGVQVLGGVSSAIAAMDAVDADTLVVTPSRSLPPSRLRQLSWALEPDLRHLVVATGLVDVAGPRISTRPVAGLPLVQVETPRYTGGARIVKRATDLLLASLGLIVLSPFLLGIGIAVKFDSPGAVFFRQSRVGRHGELFAMLKFRSMRADAEEVLAELARTRAVAGEADAGNAVLFKMKDDPRVTRVGRFLRRYSLDEFPQLLNVIKGEMSLVGPRPPLPREVEQYATEVNRKFLVTPGITGLWQVSGRSNLNWEESVRLDLYYVENWSLAGDLVILWRTARAIFARDGGAY